MEGQKPEYLRGLSANERTRLRREKRKASRERQRAENAQAQKTPKTSVSEAALRERLLD